VSGQLIDRLAFVVCVANPALPMAANRALVQKAVTNAVTNNTDVRIDGCATMGEKLQARAGANLIVGIVCGILRARTTAPYGFNNPSLAQINVNQPLNQPVLDHLDVITGNVTGYVSPANTAAYAGEAGKVLTGVAGDPAATYKADDPATLNTSAKKVKTFNSTNWTATAGGIRTMTYVVTAAQASSYYRLRGTNLPPSTPNETDADGNPLIDYSVLPFDVTKPGNVPCTDALCPSHLRTINGVKYSGFDVAAWADLWFYSNPVYIEIIGGTAVAGVQ
jgi:hypothetical protein